MPCQALFSEAPSLGKPLLVAFLLLDSHICADANFSNVNYFHHRPWVNRQQHHAAMMRSDTSGPAKPFLSEDFSLNRSG